MSPGVAIRSALPRIRPAARQVEGWLHRWGALLLLLFAFGYYAQYYRSGLNLSGEGGTTAIIAMRLLEGWIPFKDTFLGYNLLWFYPVTWLFQVTGPSYLALRIYFFALCALAGLVAFLIVRRVSGSGALATGIGAVVILIPGMLFRNYMGLLPLLCAWTFLHAFVFAPSGRARWGWFVAAGAALGLTFLVRVEIGHFMLVIVAGLAVLFPLGHAGQFRRRVGVGFGGLMVTLAVALALQMPFYVDGRKRGYAEEFVGQYLSFWSLLGHYASEEWRKHAPPPPKPAAAPVAAPATPSAESVAAPGAGNAEAEARRQQRIAERKAARLAARKAETPAAPAPEDVTRPRPRLQEITRQKSLNDALFVLILHLPILVSLIMVGGASLALGWALVRGGSGLKESALTVLVPTGCALTLFPQYFFFRPDTPHLSEFMVPFVVAMACAVVVAWRWAGGRRWAMAGAAAFTGLCIVSETLYAAHSFPKESAGTIAAKRKRTHEMRGENGVRVWLKRREAEEMQGLHDAVVRHSTPADWVLVLPYGPTVNFMTNRRTYVHNPYLDNATPGGRQFLRDGSRQIEQFQPAVIVVNHRDINGTEYSRFRNWAAEPYAAIRARYALVGTFDDNEVFVRPDKLPAGAGAGAGDQPR